MEPPYGRYGSFNYYLARRIEHIGVNTDSKETKPRFIKDDLDHTNLKEDKTSVVVITFEMS